LGLRQHGKTPHIINTPRHSTAELQPTLDKDMRTTSSRQEVADLLGVHPQTIYRWERDGHVPPPKRITRTQECFYTAEDIEVLRQWRDATTEGAAV
jgi:predicted DNA-binding transcriptional regulator AlpA